MPCSLFQAHDCAEHVRDRRIRFHAKRARRILRQRFAVAMRLRVERRFRIELANVGVVLANLARAKHVFQLGFVALRREQVRKTLRNLLAHDFIDGATECGHHTSP
jgi:hypothetical protein